eukprot:8170161-Pyramimonas_sp.AAC.1
MRSTGAEAVEERRNQKELKDGSAVRPPGLPLRGRETRSEVTERGETFSGHLVFILCSMRSGDP